MRVSDALAQEIQLRSVVCAAALVSPSRSCFSDLPPKLQFKESPVGLPAVGTTFECKPCECEKPVAGQLLIKPLFFSVDPCVGYKEQTSASGFSVTDKYVVTDLLPLCWLARADFVERRYLRGRMAGTQSYVGGYRVGEPLDSLFVGEVLESGAPDKFSAGELVSVSVSTVGCQPHSSDHENGTTKPRPPLMR